MMTYTRKTYRLGTTAIAAVLALSSTQLPAQEAPSIDAPAEAPAATVAPVPVIDAPAPAADPLAPTAEPATPADSIEASSASPEIKTAPKTVKRSVEKAGRTSERSAAKAVEPVAPDPRPAIEPSESSSPLESMKPAEIASIPDPKPVENAKLDEAVPLAGGAGAVILALAGAGMAVRRRKRRHDEDGLEQEWQGETAIADEPMAEPEALWDPPVREPAAMAVAETAQPNDLPEDFDTSTFGQHVQAAYRGPTPDNPSLSLRKRLKIAGELDRREREFGQIAETARPVPAPPVIKPLVATAKAPQSLSFSYSGTPSQMKWPEKQH